MLTLPRLAKLTGVPTSTLRAWHRRGILSAALVPMPIHPSGAVLVSSVAEVERARVVAREIQCRPRGPRRPAETSSPCESCGRNPCDCATVGGPIWTPKNPKPATD